MIEGILILDWEGSAVGRGVSYAKEFLDRLQELTKVPDGCVIGITGAGLRLEALRIDPLGKMIKVKAHIQTDGWLDYGAITKDTIIGTIGEKKRLECLCLEGDFEWRVHLAKSGWTEADGVSTLGTVGQSLQMEAIEIRRK